MQRAVAWFPSSIALTLLVVLGPPCVVVAILVALKVDARNPAVTGGITAGVLGLIVLSVLGS
ncbi:MAG TPA: hypothetical protein VLM85_27400 [Polyangiaceae bacterium]|nr:hypothetical protein [Polyangiaceae bacterium]